ncbi:MAG: hypothetical protein EPO26_04980 [Chloroflexota bacterium]|nr:MAG: hypothetical protein EPO26_04980 [Chloroflexota bacterium]
MFIRWLRKGELPGLDDWDLWRLREIAAWGDGGRRLGSHWEAIGGAALTEMFGERVVPLWSDRALSRWLGTIGGRNPDAIAWERDGSEITLRALDLKFSVDTAEHDQVSADTLAGLFERGGERLAALLPMAETMRFADGAFVSPERPLNRAFTRSGANARLSRPIRDDDIVYLPFDAHGFFEAMPGWRVAIALARIEDALDDLVDTETASRYYHLGVGIHGEMSEARRGIFAPREGVADDELLRLSPEDEAESVVDLDRIARAGDLTSARAIARWLERRRAGRQHVVARRKEIEKLPYRWAEYLSDARRRGLDLGDADTNAAVRTLHRALAHGHRDAVRARGREMALGGMTDEEALDALMAEHERFSVDARRSARARLDELRHA